MFNLEKIFKFFNSGKIVKIRSKLTLSLDKFSNISTLAIFFNSSKSLSFDNLDIPPILIFSFFNISGLC